MGSNQIYGGSDMGDQDRYIHLKDIFVDPIGRRAGSVLKLRVFIMNSAGAKRSERICNNKFKEDDLVHCNVDMYVRASQLIRLVINSEDSEGLFDKIVAVISVKFRPDEFGDERAVEQLVGFHHGFTMNFVCGKSKSWVDITRVLASQARADLALEAPRFLKIPQPEGEAAQV